jgi:hypothetical protein
VVRAPVDAVDHGIGRAIRRQARGRSAGRRSDHRLSPASTYSPRRARCRDR